LDEKTMKAVIQRVRSASVTVEGAIVGQIGQGIMVLLGVEKGDREASADWLAEKIVALRIFEDEAGKMNRALAEIGGAVLAVSQFTLAGNCDKGRRPSFDSAAPADDGKRLYDYFVNALRRLQVPVQTGIFQADMQVALVNDGPVTFILERR
jgi:D-tyrosyl-tRNA(Tyr) deacylase